MKEKVKKPKVRSSGQIVSRGRNVYLIRILLGTDINGKRLYLNETVHGNKRQAQKVKRERERERDSGQLIQDARISLNELLDRWLEEIAQFKVRRVTYDGYVAKINKHIRPTLGLKRLCDIKAFDVQKLYNELMRNGLSPTTVHHIHNILSPVMKQAIKWNLIAQNPCDVCELPKRRKKEMKYLDQDEVNIFLEQARGDRFFPVFALAIETGMRPEEYLGLQWRDIDFNNGKLSVRRALVIMKGGGFEFTEPKSAKSRRSIPLSASMLEILRNHRRDMLELKLKMGDAFQNNDLVFPSEVGTPVLSGNLDKRHFKKILKQAGLRKIRLYDLRHTMATMLLSKGVNPKIVSERLGHSSVALTLDIYSHVLPTMQLDATNHMEDLMFGSVNAVQESWNIPNLDLY